MAVVIDRLSTATMTSVAIGKGGRRSVVDSVTPVEGGQLLHTIIVPGTPNEAVAAEAEAFADGIQSPSRLPRGS